MLVLVLMFVPERYLSQLLIVDSRRPRKTAILSAGDDNQPTKKMMTKGGGNQPTRKMTRRRKSADKEETTKWDGDDERKNKKG